jgi:hypothetical protein
MTRAMASAMGMAPAAAQDAAKDTDPRRLCRRSCRCGSLVWEPCRRWPLHARRNVPLRPLREGEGAVVSTCMRALREADGICDTSVVVRVLREPCTGRSTRMRSTPLREGGERSRQEPSWRACLCAWRRGRSKAMLDRFVCVIRVPVCPRVSRVCPGSPRYLFTVPVFIET